MTILDIDSLDPVARGLAAAGAELSARALRLRQAATGAEWSSATARLWFDALAGSLDDLQARAEQLDDLAGRVRSQAAAAEAALARAARTAAGLAGDAEHLAGDVAGSVWHSLTGVL